MPQPRDVDLDLVVDLIVNLLGNADPARFGHRFDARADVQAVAQHVAVFENDVADVDTDADFEAVALGRGRVMLHNRLLCGDRTLDRLKRAPELGQEPVADRLDLLALIGREEFPQQSPVGKEKNTIIQFTRR